MRDHDELRAQRVGAARYDPPNSFDYIVDRSFPPARHEGGTMTFTVVPGGTKVILDACATDLAGRTIG